MRTNTEDQKSVLVLQEVSAQHKVSSTARTHGAVGPRLDTISINVSAGESVGILGTVSDGIGILTDVIGGRLAPSKGHVYVRPSVCVLESPTTTELQLELYEAVQRIAMTQDVNGRALKKAVSRTLKQASLDEGLIGTPLVDLETSVVDLARLSAALNTAPALLVATTTITAGNSLLTTPGNVWFERFIARGGSALLIDQSTRTLVRACSRIIWLHQGRILMDRPAIEVHRAKSTLDAIKDDKLLVSKYLRRYEQEYVSPKFLLSV